MSAAAPQLEYLLRPIQRFLDDPGCEDIYCNEPGRLLVRRGAVTTPYDVPELDTDTLEDIAILAGATRGQDVGRASPMLATELPGGQRLQAVLPPAVANGRISLTIRRPNDAAPSLDSLQSGLRASHNCGTKCHVPSLEEGVETAETPGDGFRAGWLVAA